MNDLIAQLALVDMLLCNWDGIRVRMEPVAPSLQSRLTVLARRISQAGTPAELARVVDELLDVVLDTPAEAFVRDLVARARIDVADARARDVVGPAAADPILDARMAQKTRAVAASAGATVAASAPIRVVPVFFATNRARQAGSIVPTFTGQRGDGNTYGLARVAIPQAHRPGQLEQPAWWNLLAQHDDETRYVVLRSVWELEPPAFGSMLERTVAQGANDLVVFVHGYRVAFEDAARRAAQLAADLALPGAVVLFSWPSGGGLLDYNADGERANNAWRDLRALLQVLAGGPWRKVHVIAHSMGNRVTTQCLGADGPLELPFGELVLAAADVDVETFCSNFNSIAGRVGSRITSYASRMDFALLTSRVFNKIDRVGFIDQVPFTHAGMETVDASAVDTDLLGHSYFAQESPLLADLRTLLGQGERAPRNLQHPDGCGWWRFPESPGS